MRNRSARHAGLVQHLLDRERAAGHVAGMLQQRAVAGHQRRRGEAEHLPEREIPRHHREHDADRVEGDERFGPADVGRLVGEIVLRRGRRTSRNGRRISRPRRGRRRASCPSPRSSAAANSSLRARRISRGLADDRRPLGERRPAPRLERRAQRQPRLAPSSSVCLDRRIGRARPVAGLTVCSCPRVLDRVSSACSAMASLLRRPHTGQRPAARNVRRNGDFARQLERAKGFEPSTPTLARLCSTPELRPL